MAKKMAILCSSNSPNSVFPPFMIGLGALASDMDVMLFFTMDGMDVVTKGGAEKIELPGAPMTLSEMIGKATEMGARLVACSACFPIKGITEDDLIEGVTVGGAAMFVSEADEADIVLTF